MFLLFILPFLFAMKNTSGGDGGGEGSSSSPNTNAPGQGDNNPESHGASTPRRGGERSPGSSSRQAVPRYRPAMGTENPWRPTSTPPRPFHQGSSSPSAGSSSGAAAGGSGIGRVPPSAGMQAIAVGGAGGSAAGDGVVIGGSRLRKRGREAGEGSSAAAGGGRENLMMRRPFPCFICGREFNSIKGLFGHMRCHPERTWRGVLPPPTFDRAEFADLFRQFLGGGEVTDEAIAAAAAAQQGGEGAEGGAAEAAEPAPAERNLPDLNTGEEEPKEGTKYLLPDLNFPPGDDDNQG